LWPEPGPFILCIPALVFTDKTHSSSQYPPASLNTSYLNSPVLLLMRPCVLR